jgi:hypothetical protein
MTLFLYLNLSIFNTKKLGNPSFFPLDLFNVRLNFRLQKMMSKVEYAVYYNEKASLKRGLKK